MSLFNDSVVNILPIFDRLFNLKSQEAAKPRSYMNKLMCSELSVLPLGNTEDQTEHMVVTFMEILGLENEANIVAKQAFAFRNVPLTSRYLPTTRLLLIVHNPGAGTASYSMPGYMGPGTAFNSVKMVDSGGNFVPDFEYDSRVRDGFSTYIYNTETKQWRRLAYSRGWAEKSELGDEIQTFKEKAKPIELEEDMLKSLRYLKHRFSMVASMESEASLLFTELATSAVITLVTGHLQRLDDLQQTSIFVRNRPEEWSKLSATIRQMFPKDVADPLLNTNLGAWFRLDQIGRIKFIIRSQDNAIDSPAPEINFSDLEKEGSFVIVSEDSIYINNHAINDLLISTGRPYTPVTNLTARWHLPEVSVKAVNEDKPADGEEGREEMTKQFNAVEESKRLERAIILSRLMKEMGVPVTFLSVEDKAFLEGKPSYLGSAVFPEIWKIPALDLPDCEYVPLKEAKTPGVMFVKLDPVGTGCNVSIWETGKHELRIVDATIADVLNTAIASKESGSLLLCINNVVTLIDSEVRIIADRIDSDTFSHDAVMLLKSIIDGRLQEQRDNDSIKRRRTEEALTKNVRLSDPNDSPIQAIMRENRATETTEHDADSQIHRHLVNIGKEVIACVRVHGRNSIGDLQLVWVQETLSQELFTREEIGLASDEHLIKNNNIWYIGKEI